ncbi:protein of unknown function [Taphrina deformans PYCC 5710]|uniref:LysM domain-containing protein n=1 Tax=Taphrina deformans (strain PYCC 5710 / ATCC 11124 / CBS 356.35 / IMI 108563 / JCM 9778 / NBRC 8474) TaxID=1097556 RepID=R4XDT3_TAPDE|nr:protein of unknown function [Taphrina deformans PYCC 5710]|eukprot:CCG84031.1 protein of unknown function [Taphrina deformans PYCC 5710]
MRFTTSYIFFIVFGLAATAPSAQNDGRAQVLRKRTDSVVFQNTTTEFPTEPSSSEGSSFTGSDLSQPTTITASTTSTDSDTSIATTEDLASSSSSIFIVADETRSESTASPTTNSDATFSATTSFDLGAENTSDASPSQSFESPTSTLEDETTSTLSVESSSDDLTFVPSPTFTSDGSASSTTIETQEASSTTLLYTSGLVSEPSSTTTTSTTLSENDTSSAVATEPILTLSPTESATTAQITASTQSGVTPSGGAGVDSDGRSRSSSAISDDSLTLTSSTFESTSETTDLASSSSSSDSTTVMQLSASATTETLFTLILSPTGISSTLTDSVSDVDAGIATSVFTASTDFTDIISSTNTRSGGGGIDPESRFTWSTATDVMDGTSAQISPLPTTDFFATMFVETSMIMSALSSNTTSMDLPVKTSTTSNLATTTQTATDTGIEGTGTQTTTRSGGADVDPNKNTRSVAATTTATTTTTTNWETITKPVISTVTQTRTVIIEETEIDYVTEIIEYFVITIEPKTKYQTFTQYLTTTLYPPSHQYGYEHDDTWNSNHDQNDKHEPNQIGLVGTPCTKTLTEMFTVTCLPQGPVIHGEPGCNAGWLPATPTGSTIPNYPAGGAGVDATHPQSSGIGNPDTSGSTSNGSGKDSSKSSSDADISGYNNNGSKSETGSAIGFVYGWNVAFAAVTYTITQTSLVASTGVTVILAPTNGVTATVTMGDGGIWAIAPSPAPASTITVSVTKTVTVSSQAVATPICRTTYTVVDGDICDAIVAKTGITLASLYALNPSINNPSCNNLAVNQVLCVESGSSKKSLSSTLTSAPAANSHKPYPGVQVATYTSVWPVIVLEPVVYVIIIDVIELVNVFYVDPSNGENKQAYTTIYSTKTSYLTSTTLQTTTVTVTKTEAATASTSMPVAEGKVEGLVAPNEVQGLSGIIAVSTGRYTNITVNSTTTTTTNSSISFAEFSNTTNGTSSNTTDFL